MAGPTLVRFSGDSEAKKAHLPPAPSPKRRGGERQKHPVLWQALRASGSPSPRRGGGWGEGLLLPRSAFLRRGGAELLAGPGHQLLEPFARLGPGLVAQGN